MEGHPAMSLTFTPEHEELRQTVRRFLAEKSPISAVRKTMTTDAGFDDAVWSQMAEQIGLQGLIVPEAHGGAGMGATELAIVMEEMGRVLLCAPFLSTVLATQALLLAGSDAARGELLPGIAAGTTRATLASVEPGGDWEPSAARATAKQDGSDWKLDGEKSFVLDGHTADVLLVTARTADGLSLFRVDAGAPGLERKALPTLDLTRKLANVSLNGARATRIGAAGDLTPAIERAVQWAIAALAAEQAGGAQRCLETATDYAKTRLQFGRPIGSFQAIKHRCADMLVSAEFAKSAAYGAAGALDEEGGAADEAVAIAKSYCSEAFFQAAGDNIQIHGGMGFTWEADAHLYFKRAKSSSLLFGDPVKHREKLAARIGL
jgi:alkylation response protein AidB-like acyl-CoA dehydrogenase